MTSREKNRWQERTSRKQVLQKVSKRSQEADDGQKAGAPKAEGQNQAGEGQATGYWWAENWSRK